MCEGTEIRLCDLRNIGCWSSVEKFPGATFRSISAGLGFAQDLPKTRPLKIKTAHQPRLFAFIEMVNGPMTSAPERSPHPQGLSALV